MLINGVDIPIEPNADLSFCDLSYTDLSNSNLRGANLRRANLTGTNLSGSILINANLDNAYMGRVDLTNADLSNANIREAYLLEAKLEGAIIPRANFDERGYTFHVKMTKEEVIFIAGCRKFNYTEAFLHWAYPIYPDRNRGNFYVLHCKLYYNVWRGLYGDS